MRDAQPAIVAQAIVSALGCGLQENLDAAFATDDAFSTPDWFDSKGHTLGIRRLQNHADPSRSRIETLLDELQPQLPQLPPDTRIYLATTVGAIDLLERDPNAEDALVTLRHSVMRRFDTRDVRLAAVACASGQIAATMAARAIARGECRMALALGADIVSEFVTSGFASLGALTPERIRPYDAARQGLALGEGAAALLFEASDAPGLPRLLGWGESCDAAHITAPDLTGESLATAIRAALAMASLHPEDIGGIVGHGTGTIYNDQAEIAAIRAVFPEPLPLFSLKGVTGHTIGAAGLMQLIVADSAARRRLLPPQAGLRTPMPGAEGLVSPHPQPLRSGVLLSLNIGFGGLNSAVILEGGVP